MDRYHPFGTRLRLYNQCVLPILSYGIHEMGTSARWPHADWTTLELPYAATIVPHWVSASPTRRFDSWSHANRQSGYLCTNPSISWQSFGTCDPVYWSVPSGAWAQMSRARSNFSQVGPWKRYIRKFHQIPCLNEDLFDPLRDIFGDKAICRHYNKQFIDLYRLKYHINVRICLSFDMTKDSIVPIAARPSLCMHLHYKSIPSILFDKALVCDSSPLCVLSFSRSCSIDSQALWRTASRIIGLWGPAPRPGLRISQFRQWARHLYPLCPTLQWCPESSMWYIASD